MVISLVSPATLDRLAEIAVEAGSAAMQYYRQSDGVELKGDGSPVTRADRAAHNVIVPALKRLADNIPVISEEGDTPAYAERRNWPRFWLVDPLDGTKEFISANGEFTVNIALIEDGRPVLGVVSAPALDMLYLAGYGLGAWKRIGREPRQQLTPGLKPRAVTRVVESRSHPSPELETFLAGLGPVERIPLGSSLKFCKVAEGEADLYPRFGRTMEWDVAAGDCVFRNSGPTGEQRESPLCYNQPTLSSPGFILDGRV
jgi:3'(2'), 5'-bisphosphate nucleotidase